MFGVVIGEWRYSTGVASKFRSLSADGRLDQHGHEPSICYTRPIPYILTGVVTGTRAIFRASGECMASS